MSTTHGEPLPGLLARLGDRLNPLVVKEVRQGLRTRVFWVSFGLMLLACLILSMVAYVNARDNGFTSGGQEFFFAFFVCLGLVHFFVIPYSAYRSLAREREDETWVLLVLTGLGPRRILRGKVASFLVQAGLYASAVGPFLLFSYYLNGIDLPTILGVLTLGGAWLFFLTVVAVCAATLADGRMGRALVHLVLLGTLGVALVYALVAAFILGEQGHNLWREDEFIAFTACFLWAMLTYGWLLFETAAARLALPTENYSRGPRLALVVQLVLSGAVVVLLWHSQGQDKDIAVMASILVGYLHLSLTGLFVATDVDGQARPLRADTRPWSLLRPGAVRGFRLVVLLLLVWMGLCGGLYALSVNDLTDEASFLVVLAAPAYVLLYLSLALLVGRMPRSERLASPAVVRVLFFVLLGLAGAVPPLVAVLLEQAADDPLLNLLNPFVGLVNFGDRDYVLGGGPKMNLWLVACVWLVAVLAAFAADRSLVERERRVHAT